GLLNVAFTPDSRLLALSKGDEPGYVRLVRPDSGAELVRLFTADHTRIHPLGFTADGRRLCALGENNQLYVWDLACIRRQLRGLGLDWDDAPLPPPTPLAPEPLVVHLDEEVAAMPLGDDLALIDQLLANRDVKAAQTQARKTVELYPRAAAAQ